MKRHVREMQKRAVQRRNGERYVLCERVIRAAGFIEERVDVGEIEGDAAEGIASLAAVLGDLGRAVRELPPGPSRATLRRVEAAWGEDVGAIASSGSE